MIDKTVLREESRKRLQMLSAAERERLGARVADRVWQVAEVATAEVVLLYAALPEEVPTSLIAEEARRRGVEVVYPRCLPEGRQMTLHSVVDDADLLPGGRYGIREPALHCPTTDVAQIDVAFVPGLAWDRAGHRLGRGAGYYDRLLAAPAWRALRCGLFFATQEVALIPVDPWDVELDLVVTDEDVVRP